MDKSLGASPGRAYLTLLIFCCPGSVPEVHLTAREDVQYGLCVQKEKEMGFGDCTNKYLCHNTQSFTANTSSYIKGHNYTYFGVVMIK